MSRKTRNLILFMLPLSASLLIARDATSAALTGRVIDFLANHSLFVWESHLLGWNVTAYQKQFFATAIPLSIPFLIAIVWDVLKDRDALNNSIVNARDAGYSSMKFEDPRLIVVSKYILFGFFIYIMRLAAIALLGAGAASTDQTDRLLQVIGPFIVLYMSFISLSIFTMALMRSLISYPVDEQRISVE